MGRLLEVIQKSLYSLDAGFIKWTGEQIKCELEGICSSKNTNEICNYKILRDCKKRMEYFTNLKVIKKY
jgi:hypothetical protein